MAFEYLRKLREFKDLGRGPGPVVRLPKRRKSSGGASRARGHRPWLEALEDRTAPAILTVTSAADDGPGTLRGQIDAAASGDTIDFDLAQFSSPIALTGTLFIAKDLTIQGPGATALAVQGNNTFGIFQIDIGFTVTIDGLTITGGNSDRGGGIYNNRGTLTLSNSTLSGNSANDGGGIFNYFRGTVTVQNCTLSGNSADLQGGGISNTNEGTVTVQNSTLSGNTANA